MDALINLLAVVAVFLMMAGVGLELNPADALKVARDWRLSLRAGMANYVVVPAAAIGLLLFFHPEPIVAAGLLISVAFPGAPFAAVFAARARGNVPMAVGLMAILACSSAIVAPVLLTFLLPIVAGSIDVSLQPVKILGTLGLGQFLPMGMGLLLRHLAPSFSGHLRAPLKSLTMLFNLGLVGLVFVVQFRLLRHIRPSGYLGMGALVLASLAAGWLLSGGGAEQRRTIAVTTAARNVGVSLAILAGSFPGTAAITAATAFALFQIAGLIVIAEIWGRASSLRSVHISSAAG